ncbi:MAG: SAF domain-containing protein [Oligoflexia bacterium]|nr:SAF domain-containing protein [Oligoflexia bacterium]
MRVHPSILGSGGKRWQYPAVVALLLFLLLVNVVRGPKEVVVAAAPTPVEKRLEVLIAREAIQPGQPLDKANVVLETRPAYTLTKDAVTNFDALKNKVAAGPIPAGYPIAVSLLADPVAVVPVSDRKGQKDVDDPVETLLKEIEQETVAVPITFASTPPGRGARIALTLNNPHGDPVVVIEDCWVSKANGREAVLRLEPQQALLLQSAKSYGNFNFIEIPTEGQSPYAGKGVGSKDQLTRMLEGESKVVTNAQAKPEARKMKGYAWVTGEGIRYGLDDEGSIKVVRPEQNEE